MIAVSADEVWVWGEVEPSTDEWEYVGLGSWFRYLLGEWIPVGPDSELPCSAVLASDGAVWSGFVKGQGHELGRSTGGVFEAVADELQGCPLSAGPDGSVWVGPRHLGSDGASSEVSLVWADGTQAVVERPEGYDYFCAPGGGSDGSLWLTIPFSEEGGNECGNAGSLARWDGRRWTMFAPPASAGDLSEALVVDGDGTSWAAFVSDTSATIGKFSAGSWVMVGTAAPSGRFDQVTAIPGGGVCMREYLEADEGSRYRVTGIVCFATSGEIARFPTADREVTDFSVAPDGAIWVVLDGSQVGRLHETLPGTR